MELTVTPRRKRFCIDQTEILRVEQALPAAEGESDAYRVMDTLYREIAARSLRFAETVLLSYCREQYEALSEHDRKFCVPRRLFRVEALLREEAPDCISVELCVTWRAGKATVFERRERQTWGMREGVYRMIPPKETNSCKPQQKLR